MKQLGYILIASLLLIGFSACEKEEIVPDFSNSTSVDSNVEDDDRNNNNSNSYYTRGSEGGQGSSNNGDLGGEGPDSEDDNIKDPDEDPDFDKDDNIVDPDEDEDFEEEEKGEDGV